MLHDPGDDTEGVNILGPGLIDLRVALGGEENSFVRSLECALESHHGRPSPDDERGHHVREYDHIPQGNDRKVNGRGFWGHELALCWMRVFLPGVGRMGD